MVMLESIAFVKHSVRSVNQNRTASSLQDRQDPSWLLEPQKWQSWGLNITPHPLLAGEEELRPSLWEGVPKQVLTSPARVMNPDIQTKIRAAILLVRTETKQNKTKAMGSLA